VYANDAAVKVFRRTREELYGKTDEEVFPPETAAQFRENDRRARASATGVQMVETLEHEDGLQHYSIVSKFPIPGPDEGPALVGGMAIDVTEHRQAEQTVRASEERLRLALQAGQMGVWEWNLRTNEIKWSDNLEPIHGLAPGSFGGTLAAFEQLIYPDDRERVRGAIARALQEQSSYDVEFRNVWPDGSVHWMSGKGKVFVESGEPVRMIGVGTDVTDRKRAEQDSRFLADASAALAGLVDYESTLQKVARLAVPTFADWCAVDILDEGDVLRRLAVAHVDPSKVELAHALYRRNPPDPASRQGAWNVVRTGKSTIVPEITDELLTTSVKDAETLGIVRTLGLRSYMCVPLAARGKVLGVVTFVAAESGRRYTAADLAVAEDLAHRAAVAVENTRLYQTVREADRRKDEFLAMLGHELRNPLAPIRTSLFVLKMPGADAAIARRAREMMERQVEHLVRLVDDLLDVSRIMRGKVELLREPVELATVVARAVETSQPVLDAEGHRLTVALPPEPLSVDGDPVRLAQVVSNLLNNAAKYTERGGQVWLTVGREGGEAVVRVRDSGIGIAPQLLPRLFDMFFQAERRTKDSQGGLGIGLSLVRRLVQLHGGTVEAHSAGLGKGSEFVVRLPLLIKDEDEGQRRGDADPAPPGELTPRRVLVVDDNVDAADSLALMLRLQGQDVQVAYDGPSALAQAQANPPDVAFLDLGMPKVDGYDLARSFRTHPDLKGVVLVALTGWGQPEDRQRTKEAGFDHHLVKPVEAAALHQLLARQA
jgi:PAS domain S-box-containing protein